MAALSVGVAASGGLERGHDGLAAAAPPASSACFCNYLRAFSAAMRSASAAALALPTWTAE
jgi:hypothetical protein